MIQNEVGVDSYMCQVKGIKISRKYHDGGGYRGGGEVEIHGINLFSGQFTSDHFKVGGKKEHMRRRITRPAFITITSDASTHLRLTCGCIDELHFTVVTRDGHM